MKFLIKKTQSRVIKILNYPMILMYYFLSLWPNFFYTKIVEKTNLNQVVVILSFDCDIDEDIDLLPSLLEQLSDIDIMPSLMIPTEILFQRKPETTKLMNEGYEFVNHGHRVHTIRVGYNYYSSFDYEKLSLQQMEEDIVSADSIFKTEFDYSPKGFRTPHFGNVQSKKRINFIYKVIKDLNYTFSSSTIPYFMYRFGPHRINGLIEIPLSGIYSVPLRILDSFNYYDPITGSFSGVTYFAEIRKLMDVYIKRKRGVINLYVDPSHVFNDKHFLDSMKLLRQNFTFVNYSNLLERIKND